MSHQNRNNGGGGGAKATEQEEAAISGVNSDIGQGRAVAVKAPSAPSYAFNEEVYHTPPRVVESEGILHAAAIPFGADNLAKAITDTFNHNMGPEDDASIFTTTGNCRVSHATLPLLKQAIKSA